MHFNVAGPFKIELFGERDLIDKRSIPGLRIQMENWSEGLSEACGCYVVARRTAKGIVPWYVGQACKTSILKESMNETNCGKYNAKIEGKGTRLLFAIPAITPTGKFRKKSEAGWLPAFDFLERWLIAEALRKNTNLINTKETRFLRGLYVRGVFNSKTGDATKPSTALRKALKK